MIARSLVMLFALVVLAAPDAEKDGRSKDQRALQPLQGFIGSWRSVGQPRRGSTLGSWKQLDEWQWKFGKEGASLYFSTMDGKFFRSGSLTPADKKGLFELVANPQKEKSAPQLFSGRLDEAGRLVLVNPAAEGGQPARITLRLLAKGDRMTMLIEQRLGKSFYSRLAEIGCTRQGSSFGKGQVFPECIVSGGRGTIEVTFEGKTYRVCCSGCKDFFEDDPQRALAEYRERQKK
jgi:hypothetical protein